jgi:hypothetical protein
LSDLQIGSQRRDRPVVYPLMALLQQFGPLLQPLLGQSHKWRVLRDQALDRLHDGLDLNSIEVRIDVLKHSIVGCLCIRCFRSLDGWVSIGIVVGRCPIGTHHADTVDLDDRVLVDNAHDLRVVPP